MVDGHSDPTSVHLVTTNTTRELDGRVGSESVVDRVHYTSSFPQ